MAAIALLGTGLMGAPITRNLAAAGHSMTVWNRSRDRAEPLLADGVTIAASSRDCVTGAAAVFVVLSDGPTCDRLLFDPRDGFAEAMAPGSVLVMMSSIAPATARAQAARLAELRIGYMDAPVSGGERGALDATLTIFAGGPAEVVEAMRPLLADLGRVNHVGDVGSGQLVKLANQMIVGISIEAIAEALVLIERAAGGDATAAFAALEGGFADSTVLRLHGARMLTANHVPGGTVATQLKDLRMASRMAEELGLLLPLLSRTEAIFANAAAGSDAALDHSAVIRTLRANQTVPMAPERQEP